MGSPLTGAPASMRPIVVSLFYQRLHKPVESSLARSNTFDVALMQMTGALDAPLLKPCSDMRWECRFTELTSCGWALRRRLLTSNDGAKPVLPAKISWTQYLRTYCLAPGAMGGRVT